MLLQWYPNVEISWFYLENTGSTFILSQFSICSNISCSLQYLQQAVFICFLKFPPSCLLLYLGDFTLYKGIQ